MHEELVKQLKEIKNQNKIKKFIKLVEKKHYNKAFINACKECKIDNEPLNEFISILLSYKDQFDIDINKEYGKKTAIYHAAENKHLKLYYLLEKEGANPEFIGPSGDSALIKTFEHTLPASQYLFSHLKKEFKLKQSGLDAMFKDSDKLPAKSRFTNDDENAKYDQYRLDYLIERIQFLMDYFTHFDKENQLPVEVELDLYHKEILHSMSVHFAKRYLAEICTVAHNLSFTVLSQYNRQFQPEPFTWVTIDQLGAMILPKAETQYFVFPLRQIPLKAHTKNEESEMLAFVQRFLDEVRDSELIIEEAIPDIINLDLPHLKRFFEQVYAHYIKKENVCVEPVCLLAIKALTARIGDNKSLLNLLNLLNYSEHSLNSLKILNKPVGQTIILDGGDNSGEEYKKRFDLSKKSGRHAALRRLQQIGELFTGKNFSSDILNLDPTINKEAFVGVRDGLVHQDEGDALYKISEFSNNEEQLKQIVGREISDFWMKIYQLIQLRETLTGPYEKDTLQHWKRVLSLQQIKYVPKTATTMPEKETCHRRVTEEEQQIFMKCLVEKGADSSVQELFKGIFDGTGKIPERKILGPLQKQYMFSRQEDPQRASIASEIIMKAITRKKEDVSKEERNEQRRLKPLAAKQREQEKESKFQGLECLRVLAKSLQEPPIKTHLLTPLTRIKAAIAAVFNMREFLVDAKYLLRGKFYTTCEEWDKFHREYQRKSLAERLILNSELNDALEYNAGQVLQHVLHWMKITTNKDDSGYNILLENIEQLRSLRNYIEHGAPLYDNTIEYGDPLFGDVEFDETEEKEKNKEQENEGQHLVRKFPRQHRIADAVIALIYKITPVLLHIEQKLNKPESVLVSVEASDGEKENQDEAQGPDQVMLKEKSYPAMGFFGAQSNQQMKGKEKEKENGEEKEKMKNTRCYLSQA